VRIAVAEWLDAVGPQDLEEGDEFLPARAYTVGYVITDTPTHIVLAAEIFPDDGMYRACTVIPKISIVSVRDL
jgi:hypothetical protein